MGIYRNGSLYQIDREFYQQVAEGLVDGHSLVHKFGAGTLTTSLAPICLGGVYRTPTAAAALEFVSSSADDTAAGTGAREVTVIGLDLSWNEVTQTVTTNGTTAVALGTNLIRLYRWYVSSSGTYATYTAGSHAGTLTVRAAGAGDTWSIIPITPFPVSQSQIGAYTIQAGKTAYLLGKHIYTDSSKATDIYMFQRCNADDVTAPYGGAMRIFEREVGVTGQVEVATKSPRGTFVGPCDVGFMGKVESSTADVSVEFELIVVDD